MNDMVTDVRGWFDAAQAMQARHRRAPARDPCRARARARNPEDAGQSARRARRPAAGVEDRGLDHRRGRHAARREARAHGAAARRHGRAADARGYGPAVRLEDRRRDARLRPRHAHRDAGLGRARAVRPARTRSPARSSSCSSPARKASTARASCSRTACSTTRRPTPPSRCTSCPTPRRARFGAEGRAAARLGRQARAFACSARAGHASMPHHALDPDPGRLRDRHRAAGVRHAPHRRLRSGRGHGHQDQRRHHLQRHPGIGRPARHHPHAFGGTRTAAHAGIARVAESIAPAHDCRAEVEIVRGFPVTVNDARAVDVAEQARRPVGADAWITMASPIMGAEDFSYVLQNVPGAMAFLGVCPEGQDWQSACPCHSNKMELNEAAGARRRRALRHRRTVPGTWVRLTATSCVAHLHGRHEGGGMAALKLAQASAIIDAALAEGRTRRLAPLAVAVLDAGGHLMAFKREDAAGFSASRLPTGRPGARSAWASAHASWRNGRQDLQRFVTALSVASQGRMIPSPGGVLIVGADGEVVGAVGISGDTGDNDEICALAGIAAVGLSAIPGAAGG